MRGSGIGIGNRNVGSDAMGEGGVEIIGDGVGRRSPGGGGRIGNYIIPRRKRRMWSWPRPWRGKKTPQSIDQGILPLPPPLQQIQRRKGWRQWKHHWCYCRRSRRSYHDSVQQDWGVVYVQALNKAHIIGVKRERGVQRRRRVLDCERIILHLQPHHQSTQGYGVRFVVVEPWRRSRRRWRGIRRKV